MDRNGPLALTVEESQAPRTEAWLQAGVESLPGFRVEVWGWMRFEAGAGTGRWVIGAGAGGLTEFQGFHFMLLLFPPAFPAEPKHHLVPQSPT